LVFLHTQKFFLEKLIYIPDKAQQYKLFNLKNRKYDK